MWNWIKRNILIFAWTIALVSMLGSLYFSEILGWVPCSLCWYQRILMYPLVIILLVGILRKTQDLVYYILPFSIIGLAVAFYQNLLQWGMVAETSTVCKTSVSCVIDYHIFSRFITIPLLSLLAFAVITICIIISNKSIK